MTIGKFIRFESLTCGGKSRQAIRLMKYFKYLGVPVITNAEPTTHNAVGIVIRRLIESQLIEDYLINDFVEQINSYISSINSNSGMFLRGAESNDVVGEFIKTVNNAMSVVVSRKKPDNKGLQSLYVVDRHIDLRNVIIPNTEAGITVAQDRFDMSSIVFGEAFGGVTIEDVYKWHLHVIGGEYKIPDYDFYIKVMPETAMERLEKDGKIKDQFEKKLDSLKRTAEIFEKAIVFMNKQYSLQDPNKKIIIIDGEKSEEDVFGDIISNIIL